ncbi:MAG: hypothetical protein MUF54_05960 [Polyangiaceae bacterium]|nr:hypothetical protein [Polyangiaceae bacterium]
MTRSAETWWDIGLLLDEVHSRGLAEAEGHDDYVAYASRELGLDEVEVRRLRRVAHHFSRETALRFGAARLDLLLAYLESSNRLCSVLDPMRIEIPVRSLTGDDVDVPFSEATDEDLRMATRQAGAHVRVDALIPAAVEATRATLAAALRAVGGMRIQVKVHESTMGGEAYSLAVLGVDPFNMLAVGQVLVNQGRTLAAVAQAENKAGLARPAESPKSPASTATNKAGRKKATKAATASSATNRPERKKATKLVLPT